MITRSELRKVLADWEVGSRTTAQVHEWAVRSYAVSTSEPEDDVVNEVLSRLDMLDMNLTTVADIPALRQLLESDVQSLAAGMAVYDSYLAQLDLDARRRELATDPIYARFCHA